MKFLFTKLKTFTQAFLKSLSTPSYYVDVLNTKFKFSFRFFVVSYALLALFSTALFAKFELPKFSSVFNEQKILLLKNYPQDLKITWASNELSTNSTSPLQIPYPNGLQHDPKYGVLAIIAPTTSNTTEVEALSVPKSQVAVTKKDLALRNSQGDWTTVPLADTPGFEQPFTIDKSSLNSVVAQAEEVFNQSLQTLLWVYPFFFWIGVGSVRFAQICFASLLLFYLLQSFGKKLPYRKVLQIGLHVGVVAELLNVVTSQFVHESMSIFQVTFWLYALVIFMSLSRVRLVEKE